MFIAPCITLYGACQSAIAFYDEVFTIVNKEIRTFREVDNAFVSFLSPENENYVLNAYLRFQCGTTLALKDSFTLLISHQVDEIHNGCKDGPIIDVCGLGNSEIETLYNKFLAKGSTINYSLGPKDSYRKYASLIDPYFVCWNLYCP